MNGYLIEIKNLDNEYLYWFPVELEEATIQRGFKAWIEEDTELEFEDWWNKENEFIQIERVYIDTIWYDTSN